MAPGRKRLQRLQFGKESVAGTAVAATTLWRGQGAMLEDQRTVEEIEELIGLLDGGDRTVITKLLAGLELSAAPATPEQAQYLLAMAFGGPTTGTADGSGTDKIYVTNVPTTAAPTVTPYTVRGGDDFEAEIMEYAVCSKFSISGKTGESVKMGGTLIGRQAQPTTFTGSVAVPSVSELVTNKGKVFLDAITGAYGTTQVANAILEFKVDIEIMWIPKFTMDGQLYFSFLQYTGHKISGELTYEHDTPVSGTGGAKDFFRTQTPKLLRIALLGDAVATPGTTWSAKQLVIDLPIKFTKPGVLADQNGNDIVKMNFRSRNNLTAGNAGKFTVINELTALP